MLKPDSSTEPGPRRIHLNKLLVKKGFGGHSSEEGERDLREVEPDLAFGAGAANLSSDEEEEEIGVSEYDPQPLLTTEQKMTSLQLYASEESDSADTRNRFYPYNANSIKSPGIGHWLEQRKRAQAFTTSTTAPGSKVDEENLREEPKEQQDPSPEVSDSEEDIWSRVRDDRKEGESAARVHMVPAGIFVGKYHEDLVAKIQSSSAADLKRKFTNLVCK